MLTGHFFINESVFQFIECEFELNLPHLDKSRQTPNNGNRRFDGFCWISVYLSVSVDVGACFCQLCMFNQHFLGGGMSEK